MSQLEEALLIQIKAFKLPMPEREYRFAAHYVGLGNGVRERLKQAKLHDWRFDFAWPDLMWAVEVDGGGFINGRHNRGVGFQNDLDKSHAAQEIGWNLYRCSGAMINSGKSIILIAELLKRAQISRYNGNTLLQV